MSKRKLKPMRPHNPLIGRILDGLLKEEVKDVIIVDFDGVLNSLQSLYMAFCRHYKIKFNHNKIYKSGVSRKNFECLHHKMKTMKKIGVCFPDRSGYNWPFDKQAIAVFNKIQEKSNIHDIVICSSWRMGREIEELQEIFDNNGIKGRIIGCTGRYNTRGEEINIWLQEFLPHVERFVILDDESSYDIIQLFPDHCVEPKIETGGLTWKNYQQALKILDKKNEVYKFR